MPIYNRGDGIMVVRKASAMLNAQDDNGLLVGKWDDDYSMGTAPTLWTGSVKILLQYANTGIPICYAQCWVFAGVFNTWNQVRHSIWNYHCWNEVNMTRPDLPQGLGGWQVVDGTPQETSDGHFRCGPASVNAIKEGLLCHPFDSGFVFAEVNSDLVCKKRDRYGTLTPFRVDTTHIGLAMYTKGIGSDAPHNVTHNYKYREGSAEDKITMDRAEEYGCERDHSDYPVSELSVTMKTGEVSLGHDFDLVLQFENQGTDSKEVQAHLAGEVVFYTGVIASTFKYDSFSVTVPAGQTEHVVRITYLEYKAHLGSQLSLHFMLTGQADDQSLSAFTVIQLLTPPLVLTVSGITQIQQEMFVTCDFTNPFDFDLEGVQMVMEGPGLMSERTRQYDKISSQSSISWKENFIPRLAGPRRLMAALACKSLCQVSGIVDINIAPLGEATEPNPAYYVQPPPENHY
ncbi:coagulation factor XIII A chain-like [Diretmus argenteus]